MPPMGSEDVALAAAQAIGREVRLAWVASLSTSRRAAHVLIIVGLLLLLGALVGQAVAIVLVGLGSLVVGWLLLITYGVRLTWRARRLAATVAAQRKALRAGDCETAQRLCKRMSALLPSGIAPWPLVNALVESCVTAGRYAEALAVASRWSDAACARGTNLDPGSWALVEINLAEAEYCAGQLDAAELRMQKLWRRIEDKSGPFQGHPVSPIVLHGAATQRAWIAVLRGEPSLALSLLDGVHVEGLPEEYRAEVHYTRAFALCRAGDHQAAERAAREGIALASRASSLRNGTFLLGTLACAREDFLTAVEHFEAGSAHRYRAQGGDALLAWSRALRRLGRSNQAEQVARLVVERDPQSAAARGAAASSLE